MNKKTIHRIKLLQKEGLPLVKCIAIIIALGVNPDDTAQAIIDFIHGEIVNQIKGDTNV